MSTRVRARTRLGVLIGELLVDGSLLETLVGKDEVTMVVDQGLPPEPPVAEPPPVDPPPPPPPPPPVEPPVEPPPPPPPVGDAPVVLRVIPLGNSGPRVTSVSPNRNENGSYYRVPLPFFWTTEKAEVWSWQFGQNEKPPFPPRLRMMVDGEPVSDWQEPSDPVQGKYDFAYTTRVGAFADGYHVCYVESENAVPIVCHAIDFVVNGTGARLPVAEPWTTVNRFETEYPKLKNYAVQIRYGAAPPAIRPLKQRAHEPFNILLDKSEMTVTHNGRNIGSALSREWALIPSCPEGDIVIEGAQKYFHSAAITRPEATEWEPVGAAVKDGPRGVGSLAYVCDAIIRSGEQGVYFTETNGRFGVIGPQGDILTEIGMRLKPGIKPHAGVLSDLYMYGNAHNEWYRTFWEDVGDWSQVTGPHFLFEPWASVGALRMPDGALNLRDFHDGVITDTRNNRILWWNHWTAHSAEHYDAAHVPPVGYVSPPGPTGKTQLYNFVEPGPLCQEPWKVRINPVDLKYYWTNRTGHSIARCDLDGTNQEMVFESAMKPTDAQLGVPKRLSWGTNATVLRGEFIGVAATGFATAIAAGDIKLNGVDLPAIPATTTAALRAAQIADAANSVSALSGVKAVLIGSTVKLTHTATPTMVISISGTANGSTTGLANATRAGWVLDGAQGVGSMVQPVGFDFDEQGNIVFAEHYTYAVRKLKLFDDLGAEIPFAERTVETMYTILDKNGGSDSSGNKEPALVIDRDGMNGPAGDIFLACWGNNTDLRHDKFGVPRGKSGRGLNKTWRQWMFNSGQTMRSGQMHLCDGPGYSWGFDVWGGRMFVVGNASGNQHWDVSKREPGDFVVDAARWERGKEAIAGLPEILMGQAGQGNLGLPNAESMLDATDEEFRDYLLSLDVHPALVDDAVYYYRANSWFYE